MSGDAKDALQKYATAQSDDPRPQITAALARGAQATSGGRRG
jgi:hypothetical protein